MISRFSVLLMSVVVASCVGATATDPPVESDRAPASTPPVESLPPSTATEGATSPQPVTSWDSLTSARLLLGGELFGGPGNQFAIAATAYGDGFEVVGEDFRSDNDVRAVVWRTPDGMAWTRIADAGGVFSDSQMDDVAARGSRLVAIGRSRAAGAGPSDLIVWLSDDGLSWHRDPGAGASLEELGASGIASGRSGFVAWGATSSGTPVIATSPNGESWERSDFSTAFPEAVVADVTAGAQGWVAVGSRRPAEATSMKLPPAAAWISADGRHWSEASIEAFGLRAVYRGVGGYFAIGRANECGGCVGPGAYWRSDDARAWRSSGPEPTTNTSYASDGTRIVRLTNFGSITLASSLDGLTWEPLADHLAAHSEYGALAVGPHGILMLENPPNLTSESDQVDAGIWYLRGVPAS